MTLHNLIAALSDDKSLLCQSFGKRSADDVLAIFSLLDVRNAGSVTEAEFVASASLAFSSLRFSSTGKEDEEVNPLQPVKVETENSSPVPLPPPMTRRMLYTSVFNRVDTKKKGYISQKDLVQALKTRRSFIEKVFGRSGTARALDAFATLDEAGEGRVNLEQFLQSRELAFTSRVSQWQGQGGDAAAQELTPAVVGGKATEPPPPPRMTRTLLYSSVFKSIDTDNDGKVRARDLLRAMKSRRSSVSMIFGEHDTSKAFTIFNRLDEDGDGEVSMKDFQKNCEDAFLAAVEQPENEDDSFCPHPQAVAMDRPAADPPIPPPMTREMLYRSVYDQIDTKRTGYISQKDLVRACSKGRRSSIAKIFGENATKDAIKVFSDMDTDNTGMVSWKQFFEQAEEALVHKPAQRMAAPRRKSLLQPAALATASSAAPAAPALPK